MTPPLESPSPSGDRSSPRAEAAAWLVAREHGLSATQAADFERWLAADPRHAMAFSEASDVWSALSRIPARIGRPIVDRTTRVPIWRRQVFGELAAAATWALAAWWVWPAPPPWVDRPSIAAKGTWAESQLKSLPDGSHVRLNAGAEIAEAFSPGERRVRLVRGEAYFVVARDAGRPFIVHAGGVSVRAVGTAFNVRWHAQAVDVLVTEGRVEITPPTAPHPMAASSPLVGAGQRAVVNMTAHRGRPDVVVSQVSTADIVAALAWHEPLRKLGGITLHELAGDFERQTGRRLIVADEALKELQIGGRFPAGDLEGLLQLLSETYGIAAERAADGSVVLRKAPSGAPEPK